MERENDDERRKVLSKKLNQISLKTQPSLRMLAWLDATQDLIDSGDFLACDDLLIEWADQIRQHKGRG